jgi:hypothetical protein
MKRNNIKIMLWSPWILYIVTQLYFWFNYPSLPSWLPLMTRLSFFLGLFILLISRASLPITVILAIGASSGLRWVSEFSSIREAWFGQLYIAVSVLIVSLVSIIWFHHHKKSALSV